MTATKPRRIALLLLCISLSTLWSYEIRRNFQGPLKMPDFAALYYGARTALRHEDPYNPNAVLQVFRAEYPRLQPDPLNARAARLDVTFVINLPTTLLVLAPITLLPWVVAQEVWMILGAAILTVAAYLIWDLALDQAPVISGILVALMLANCEILLTIGNLAGLAVGLCLVAVWCFLKNRYVLAGVAFLAVSFVLKPHDAGLVWLYFVLAGGAFRRRAFQTLAAAGLLGLLAAAWMFPISPHWLPELQRNVDHGMANGSLNDPHPSAETNRSADQIIDLQAAVSIFKNDPRFYNPFSYLASGSLILAWAVAALRKRFSPDSALVALAAISALSLLPVYHRTHDAKILMLAIPACAALWTGKGPRRWMALALTSAAIIVTTDIPLLLLTILTSSLPTYPTTFSAKLLDLFLLQPAPLLLLVTGCFYLWVYMRSVTPGLEPGQADRPSSPVQLQSAP